MSVIVSKLWDSYLSYASNIEKEVKDVIEYLSDKVTFYQDDKITEFSDEALGLFTNDPSYNWRTDGKVDQTCIAKGLFIHHVLRRISDKRLDFFINFGGDVYIHQKGLSIVESKYGNIRFLVKDIGNVFCSTNKERPNHIPNAVHSTVFNFGYCDPVECDVNATKFLCLSDHKDRTLYLDDHNKITNKTYIASPFFCEVDNEIRNKMLLGFTDYIRPDLLNPNIEGDLNKDKELARSIRADNLGAIDECECLVFPKNTTDLGTLFEVGYALRNHKTVIRFDYINDIYEVLINPVVKGITSDNIVLDLNKLGSGIMLGYYYDRPIKYFLGSSRDNIMLMDNEEIKKPKELYPCYLSDILSDSVYRLNTLTSGS